MKYVRGDLIEIALEGHMLDVICHGCNTYNTFGSGIALTIKNIFPKAYQADCATIKGDRTKIGTYTRYDHVYQDSNRPDWSTLTILNCYTQFTYWDPNDMFSYEGLEKVLKQIAIDFPNKVIGFPLIGAGLARGDWKRIKEIFEQCLPNAWIIVKFDTDMVNIVAPTLDSRDVFLSQEALYN